jgi:hypothetical protein
MIRLHVIAEGQTEETFVNRVLASHLGGFEISTDVHCITTSRQRGRPFRGGMRTYAQPRRDIELWMKQDQRRDARFTTVFDLYALPDDFPGFEEAKRLQDPYQRVKSLEQAMETDLGNQRFVPYIQLHEFEALVLVDPQELTDEFIEQEQAIENLAALSARYDTPELIDDKTPPSKRIIDEIPAYRGRKASVGPLVTERIGLRSLREACPHFDGWLKRLEQLVECC